MNSFLRFLLVGIFNTCFGYGLIFAFMYLAGLSPELSNLLGYTAALVVSFFLNKHFTFARREQHATSKTKGELLRFLISFACAYAANYVALLVLIYQLEVNPGISQVLAGVVYVGISYFMNARFTFRYF